MKAKVTDGLPLILRRDKHSFEGRAERISERRLRRHAGLVLVLSRLVEKKGWDAVNDAWQIVCGIMRRIPVTAPK